MRGEQSKSLPQFSGNSDSQAFAVYSVIPRQARVFSIHRIFTVKSFEPAHREVGAGYSLKMRNERVVYDSAAHGTDDGHSLRANLFGDDEPETGCHLRDEAHERRSPFLGNAVTRDEACGARHALRECGPDGQIS